MIKTRLEKRAFLLQKDAHVVLGFKQVERSQFELQFNWSAVRTCTTLTDAPDLA